jgi:hypothetical protein
MDASLRAVIAKSQLELNIPSRHFYGKYLTECKEGSLMEACEKILKMRLIPMIICLTAGVVGFLFV